MKHLLKPFLLLSFLFCATSSFSQKIGHINVLELIQIMPESEAANKELEALTKTLQAELETINEELKAKSADFDAKRSTWAEAIVNEKWKEIQSLASRLEEQDQAAQKDFQDQRTKLFAPIYEKARNAIDKVAVDNGFTYIVNADAIIFADKVSSHDLLPLVKKELGIIK